MKLGKTPATYDKRDLQFEHYRTGTLPARPKAFGHEKIVASDNWGMLGNDSYGDCVLAGADHEAMIHTVNGGHPMAKFSSATALSDYSAVTGFDENDPSTDQGTNVRDAMRYRKNTGVVDAYGNRHKIGAYVALEPGNIDHLEEALFLFGAVGIGIEFPDSAMDQFNAGKPWSIVAGSTIDGGHYVPLVALRWRLEVVTWGSIQLITTAFIKKYCDEAWGVISTETLKNGVSPEGFNLLQLKSDLNAL